MNVARLNDLVRRIDCAQKGLGDAGDEPLLTREWLVTNGLGPF
jgi:hypothetical protein